MEIALQSGPLGAQESRGMGTFGPRRGTRGGNYGNSDYQRSRPDGAVRGAAPDRGYGVAADVSSQLAVGSWQLVGQFGGVQSGWQSGSLQSRQSAVGSRQSAPVSTGAVAFRGDGQCRSFPFTSSASVLIIAEIWSYSSARATASSFPGIRAGWPRRARS